MEEKLKLGNIEIGGKITVESISINILEVAGKRNYECQLTLDINMIWNEDTEIKHLSKLRWNLKENEVEKLKEKGFIKIGGRIPIGSAKPTPPVTEILEDTNYKEGFFKT